jgi:hypothetical protein
MPPDYHATVVPAADYTARHLQAARLVRRKRLPAAIAKTLRAWADGA